ncbi:MAG: sodium/proton-translocating pyrophosphatase, partial [Proteobacteria bacterium]|nr:sodium/proton-translocating pyrophosphatase [Pseudomonadota bacterium]
MSPITLITVLAAVALIAAFILNKKVTSIKIEDAASTETEAQTLRNLHKWIADGSMVFLKQEYKVMIGFMIAFAILIMLVIDDHHTENLNEGIPTAISFIVGCLISILAGYIGMKSATAANVRVAGAAKTSIADAFKIALNAGAVMGFALVGLALFGLIGIYLGLVAMLPVGIDNHILMEVMAGFGLGGSSIALFGRVGGGIYTKAADVGADLVGKVESGLPEDSPRNPAVIADNVGDNVGDVAGMGADLFGSCAESTCAAMVIGAVAFAGNIGAMMYPIMISALGVPVALITFLFINVKTEEDVARMLKRLLIVSTVLMAGVVYVATKWLLPETFQMGDQTYTGMGVYYCFLAGLVAGLVVGIITEYYTSHDFKPVREVAKSAETG